MGFGHRVYKNFDPRAKIIKVTAHEVLKDLGIKDPILNIAKSLQKEALNDPYFTSRKLYPNVDFYSGIIYKALNIPTEMFTVMFALGRVPGWIAHWREMRMNNDPIGRPRQVYTGSKKRDFLPLKNRQSLTLKMVVENLLKEKIGEYLLKKYSIPNTPVEIIKTRKEFKGDYTVILFPILSLTKLKPNQIGEDIGKYLMDNENYIEDFNIIQGFLNLTIADFFLVDLLKRLDENLKFDYKLKSEYHLIVR